MHGTSHLAIVVLMLLVAAGPGCSRDQAADPSGSGAGVAGDASSALRVDREWMMALEAGDVAVTQALLDVDFEWTDSQGRTRNRVESSEDVSALAAELRGETEVQTYHYGRVQVVTSARPGARMMRVWALRPDGWRVFAVISTAQAAGTTPFAAIGGGTGDCENPCRSMPYTPTTDNEKTIAAIFQQLKVDEWHPNPDSWAPFVLDDVYYVTATARLSKADRVAHLTRMRETGAPSVPGDPVVSMRIVDLGDSAMMMARHTPYLGGKPYYSVRVWAFRDGRWQLANTQQTVIADAPAAGLE